MKPKYFLWIVVLLACIDLTNMPAHAQTTLDQYRDIVTTKNAPQLVRDAANDLQYHLQKMAGRNFPIVNNHNAKGLHFYVGSGFFKDLDAKATAMDNEGWMIVSVPDGLLLTGSHEDTPKLAGVYHAVSLFLENQCGVRWLWPEKSGTVIPHNPQLKIPQLDSSGVPVLRRRQLMRGYQRYWDHDRYPEQITWEKRTRQGDQFNANFGHAWATVMPPEKYFSAHPEWYALVNGKRIPAQLTVSNKEMRDEFVKNLIALNEKKKEPLDIVSVSANDGFGFSEEDIQKFGSIDAAYWDFVDDIAQRVQKTHPELGIGTFAYTFSRQPPKDIAKLPSNVYLSMTLSATDLMHSKGKEDFIKFMNDWKSKGVHIILREYWGTHYFMDLPTLYPMEIADEIKTGYESGVMGVYGETGKNFATQAPNYYVLTHQLWNPEADPQKTLDEFYDAFGPASKDVRAYYEIFQGATQRAWRRKKLMLKYIPMLNSYNEMFTPDVLQKAKTALDAADKKATGDPELQAQLAFIRHGYDYTETMSQLIGLYRKLGRTGLPLEFFEYQSTVEEGRRTFKNTDFENNLEFYEKMHAQPFHYTIPEQTQWLKEAWKLGQKRVRLLNESRSDFSLNEGLYAYTLETNIRQWHQTVGKYLGILDEEEKLNYTHPKKK